MGATAQVRRYEEFVLDVGERLALQFCELPLVSEGLADKVASAGMFAASITRYLVARPHIARLLSLLAHDDLEEAFDLVRELAVRHDKIKRARHP